MAKIHTVLGELYRYIRKNNIEIAHRNDVELITGLVKQLSEGDIDASHELLTILNKLSAELIRY